MKKTQELDQVRYKIAYKMAIRHYYEISKLKVKSRIFGLAFPAIGSILIFYIPPLIIAKIISLIAKDNRVEFGELIPYVILFSVIWLLGEICWRIGIYLLIKADSVAVRQLYINALNEMLKRDISFFQDNFAGSLTKKTLAYANRFNDTSDTIVFNIVSSVIPAIFALIVLTFYSPLLSVCLAAWLMVTITIALPLIKKRRELVTLRETASNVISGHVADTYGNIEAVRAHSSEHREAAYHEKYVTDYIGKLKKSWSYQNNKIDMIISPLYVLTNASGLILSLYLASNGAISYETIIVVFAYYGGVTRFMWEFNGIYKRIEAALSDAAQFTELLLTEPTILDSEEPIKNKIVKGDIIFDNITFKYKENGRALFDKFDLNIASGEKVGLIGRSGGGKTSITKLLLRFSDVDSGAITIDGIAINKMTQSELRSYIAYVPQDPAMFHRSIAENIAYGKPNASQDEIIEAAKKAHAHEFIESLPKGYETLVGERGVKLSGGQRQRVAIARAILKDAPILLLDEATSALDSESESLIQDALKKLMKNRTAIVIAHRLSTIQNLDRIIVMEKGDIVEEGSHKELLDHNGIYAKLWAHQSGGFLED